MGMCDIETSPKTHWYMDEQRHQGLNVGQCSGKPLVHLSHLEQQAAACSTACHSCQRQVRRILECRIRRGFYLFIWWWKQITAGEICSSFSDRLLREMGLAQAGSLQAAETHRYSSCRNGERRIKSTWDGYRHIPLPRATAQVTGRIKDLGPNSSGYY